MNIAPEIFRAYDIRGTVGDPLSCEAVTAIGHAFALAVRERTGRQRPEIATGHDGRPSSPALEQALVDGLVRGGALCLRVGLGPTPMLYYAVHSLDADAGVMVTGSHNPPDYNGLKMTLGKLGPFHGDDIQDIARRAATALPDADGGSSRAETMLDAYVGRLLRDATRGRALKVVWDAGNGSAGEALQRLVQGLAGSHVVLYGEIDGSFPNHHPDPADAANLADLIAAVAAHGADLGIALDGDGDRIGVVDGEGVILGGDRLMMIWAADVLRAQPGATIIADVKSSQALFDEISRLGGTPLMWRTGHSLIKEKMAEVESPLAGEVSGHVFFADRYHGYDDALYAAVRLLDILGAGEHSLAALRRRMPTVVNTPELRVDCDDRRKFDVVRALRERLRPRGDDVVAIDGVRVSVAGGWWLLRASNTQPALTMRCEAPDTERLATVRQDLLDALASSGITPPDL